MYLKRNVLDIDITRLVIDTDISNTEQMTNSSSYVMAPEKPLRISRVVFFTFCLFDIVYDTMAEGIYRKS